jgi:hypothetical protein
MPRPRAQRGPARILGSAWWAGFTFNGITAYGDGHDSLIGGDDLSDAERDALLELCRLRLDAFREQRGEEVFAHRSRHRSPISGSVKTGRLRRHQQPAGALLPRCARQLRPPRSRLCVLRAGAHLRADG